MKRQEGEIVVKMAYSEKGILTRHFTTKELKRGEAEYISDVLMVTIRE